MKINNLKINNYGKIKNKEINFKNKINIIYGKNEAGKSTLLNFIFNSFYGISKNKKGKIISDYEKFKPLEGEEFSGKIEYELDNNEKFEIYRDFNKKNPKIFNENSEDISKQFNIDKKTGNEFFYDQTKVDEDLFISTVGILQKEVELEKNNQNFLVQKLANLVGTGEDNVSYKRAMDRINKKQLDEVGTDRTREKPINILNKKIEELENKKNKLEEYQNKKYEIAEEENNLLNIQEELKNTNNYFKEIKIFLENEKIEKEKINIKENIVNENNIKINNLKEELNEQKNNEKIKQEKINSEYKKIEKEKNKMKKNLIISFIFLIIINLLVLLFVQENFKYIILTTILIYLGVWKIIKNGLNKKQKIKKEELNKNIDNNLEIKNIENKINLLNDNNNKLQEEIIGLNNSLNYENKLEIEKINNKYKNILQENNLIKINNLEKINYEIEKIQTEINSNNIELHKIKLNKENIEPQLDKLAEIEEKINYNKNNLMELNKLNLSIEITKKVLEEAYNEMKENITPKFTNNLSKIISIITENKYNKVKYNEEKGIMVELQNGDYMPIEKLSTGTIEQLYLAFRISMIDDLSEETLPLFLDETFAYYDDERLQNILAFLAKEAEKRQIFIFTCSNRETEILKQLNLDYNFINI